MISKIEEVRQSIQKFYSQCVSAFVNSLLIGTISTVLYIIIYNVIIPESTLYTPLNFVFNDCGHGRCDHPTASIDLNTFHPKFHLKTGEQYDFVINLALPESQSNLDTGMFVMRVVLTNETPRGKLVTVEKKSTMMKYRSSLFQSLFAIVFFPLFVFGVSDHSQSLPVTLIHDYVQKPGTSLIKLEIAIESLKLNIYGGDLTVNAKLDGFRYFMCHYPLLSFLIFTPLVLCPIVTFLLTFNENSPKPGLRPKRVVYANHECDLGSPSDKTQDVCIYEGEESKKLETQEMKCNKSVEMLLTFAKKGSCEENSTSDKSSNSDASYDHCNMKDALETPKSLEELKKE